MISRRRVILGAAALPFSLRGAGLGAQGFGSWFVLVEGIGPAHSPERLRQMLAAFSQRGIPVIVGFDADTPDALVAAIAAHAREESGLVDCAVVLAQKPGDNRYFQLRAASDLRAGLAAKGWPVGLPLTSCLLAGDVKAFDPYALRAAGFRIRIAAPDAGDAGDLVLRSPDWGQLNIKGGLTCSLTDAPKAVLAAQAGTDQLFRFTLDDRATVADTERWAQAFADAIFDSAAYLTRPTDYLLQAGPGASALLGVVIDPEGPIDPDGPVAHFIAELQAHGLAFSLLADPSMQPPPGGVELCWRATDPAQVPENAACLVREAGEGVAMPPQTTIDLIMPGQSGAWTGQRGDGRYQIAAQPWDTDAPMFGLDKDPLGDRVIVIGAGDLVLPIQRRAALDRLVTVARDGTGHVLSLEGYMRAVVAPDPPLERLWSARVRFGQANTGAPRAADPSELQKDAATAWKFIERYTDDKTGFCAGTVQWGTNARSDWNLTLWDVGSQMQGIVAAGRLAVIPIDEVKRRIAKILENLPTIMIGATRLPPAVFHGQTLAAPRAEFDSCDTGRFLMALSQAVAAGAVSEDAARGAIARWDLAQVIRDDAVHDWHGGAWVDATMTHCNGYASRGYGAWGMGFARAYPPLQETPDADDLMRLLYAAGDLGALGADSLLLDILETDAEPACDYLARVLFDAQLDWFETTGQIKCASESPLNFAPWFAYHGLRVDRSGADGWVILSKDSSPRYQTPEHRAKAEVISAKAAYLWAALFPHDYSDRLLTLMRDTARVEDYGFLVGLFAEDMRPMERYSDVNTNGIILQALAALADV